ncbi:hypothetical protein Tco_1440684 [Tanacetum coccineum]
MEKYLLQLLMKAKFNWDGEKMNCYSTDGPYLGPERDRVGADLSQAEKDRLRVINILHHHQFLHNLHTFHQGDITGFRKQYYRSVVPRNGELKFQSLPKRPQNSNYFKEKMLLMQARENRVDLDEEQLLFLAGGQTNTFDDDVDEGPVQDMAKNEDNIIQADQCDAFEYDVDEAPTAQTLFMANLSSAEPVYDEAGPSYDSDTLSEVQAHDNSLDNMNEYHAEHEMQNNVQPNDVELAEVYEKRPQFELTERELMIDTQMRVIIKDHNVKEESLKKELHSVKTQLNSTINHNKLIREEVSTLKQDFKQKENKLLEEFLDMKHLKEMVEDKLYKQDQSLQTVHMLCKPKSFYDEFNRVAIGYKNPFYPSKAKQVQPALYNGHEIVKTNHDRALVHDSEDT